jgi:hypothetical protein
MTTAEVLEAVADYDDELLLADGFEEALLGVIEGCARPAVACYDYDECVRILVARGMEESDAVEYFNFNVAGAYVGETTPMFLHNFKAA